MANINIGKTKRSTDDMINGAIDKQQSWLNRRRRFTRAFLNRFNGKAAVKETTKIKTTTKTNRNKTVLHDYWFPVVCALLVILVAVFVMLFKINTPVKVVVPPVPEPIVKPVKQAVSVPTFDLVRIEKGGNIVVAGRCSHETNVSVIMNKRVVATEHTNMDGEFVYAPKTALKPGNYVISLIDSDKNIKSEDSVFVYVSAWLCIVAT